MKRALTCLCLMMLMPSLDTSIVNVGLPTLARSFSVTLHDVQWVIVVYLLVVTALIVIVGRLGDLVGRFRLLIVGIVLFAAASIWCASAQTLVGLIAARGNQGVGAAILMTLTIALARDVARKGTLGRAMGLLASMSAIGTTLGPTLGGLLITGIGWRSIFWVNVPMCAIALVLAYRAFPEATPSQAPKRFDVRGVALLLRDRVLASSLGTSLLVATVMMTTLVVGPFYLSQSLGLSVAAVGSVLSIGPLVAALTGIPAGRLVDRLGTRRVMMWGLAGMVIGLSLVAVLPIGAGVAGYIGAIVIVTSHYALFQTANGARIMANAGEERRGVVSGMLNFSRNLGLMMGASAMATIFAAFGLHVTFAVAAGAIIAAFTLSLAWT